MKPDLAAAYNNLGLVLHDRGDLDGAIARFSEAIRLDPNYAAAWNNLGLSLEAAHRFDEGIPAFDTAIRCKPDYPAAAYQLALIYERFDAAQAAERWRKYLELSRGKPAEQPWVAWAEGHLQGLHQP